MKHRLIRLRVHSWITKRNNGIHNFELVGYLAKRKGMEKANACSEAEREWKKRICRDNCPHHTGYTTNYSKKMWDKIILARLWISDNISWKKEQIASVEKKITQGRHALFKLQPLSDISVLRKPLFILIATVQSSFPKDSDVFPSRLPKWQRVEDSPICASHDLLCLKINAIAVSIF